MPKFEERDVMSLPTRASAKYPGYAITTDGRVYSFKTKRWLRPRKRGKYWRVTLLINSQRVDVDIHRLVLEIYCGDCPDGCEACHNDGNPENNHIHNLRWDTRSNNCKDTIKHGRNHTAYKSGEQHKNAKLTTIEVATIKYVYALGLYSQEALAKQYGVARTTIQSILDGRNWRHLCQS